jgi:hypothetical protein
MGEVFIPATKYVACRYCTLAIGGGNGVYTNDGYLTEVVNRPRHGGDSQARIPQLDSDQLLCL